MRRALGLLLAASLTGIALAPSAHAQVAWDAPSLMAPGAPSGWGFHLLDPHPGSDLGVLFTWRRSPAPIGYGFRVGLAEGHHDDLALLGGVNVSGSMYSSDGEVPIDVIWYSGGGLGLDGDVLVSVPGGMAVGWAFQGEDVVFRPYVGPKVVLDLLFGDDVDDDVELDVSLEIGVDLAFVTDWIIRAAASLGDRDAISIGFHVPG